ncbi:MAG: sulfotransferase [Deltaproteobacteria bacterium]|nr:sulfotransferase [Deltaproteobacteria bacterium]
MQLGRFFRTVYADNGARSRAERRRRLPDVLRYGRNALLRPLDALLTRRYADRSRAILFLVGVPRSGTTLLYQLIASHLPVAYVPNPLARFWSAPLAGAAWLSLRHGEMRPSPGYRSELGRDPDPFGPHEFSWFWHAFGDFAAHDDLRGDELDRVDWRGIARRLSALSGFHAKPLVLKSLNFTNYQVEILAKHLPQARFVWITREPLYCAQSILEARRRRYGDPARWWSVRPRDVAAWTGRPAVEQVAHQIRDIEAALARAQSRLPADRFQTVRYEALTADPVATLTPIARALGVPLRDPDALARQAFKARNQNTLEPAELRALQSALEAR